MESAIQHLDNWGQVQLKPVVIQKWIALSTKIIHHYPLNNAISFPNLCFTYPLDRDLSRPVVQGVDKVIHWINLYPMDSAWKFVFL